MFLAKDEEVTAEESMLDIARSNVLAEIDDLLLANNIKMMRLMASLGFKIGQFPEDPDFKLAGKAL